MQIHEHSTDDNRMVENVLETFLRIFQVITVAKYFKLAAWHKLLWLIFPIRSDIPNFIGHKTQKIQILIEF